MTQHLIPQQTDEDKRTMRRLGIVVALFMIATAAMAVLVGVIMG